MKLKHLVETKYEKDVSLYNKGLTRLPTDLPEKITGNFGCIENELTSLEHCPSQIDGNFHCYGNKLTSLEHCPSQIGGDFYCGYNQLTSLKFCPSQIGGDFSCSHNKLTSLEHCPSHIGGDFLCRENELTSLEHCPSQINGDFSCGHNELTSLKDVHTHIKKVDGGFRCYSNHIESHILGLMLIDIGGEIITRLGDGKDVDTILNKWKNQGRRGVLGAQRELLDLGYAELAQL